MVWWWERKRYWSRVLHGRGGNGDRESGQSWDWRPFLQPGFICINKITNEGGIPGHQKAETNWREFFHCPFILNLKHYSIIFKYFPPMFQPSMNEVSGFFFLLYFSKCPSGSGSLTWWEKRHTEFLILGDFFKETMEAEMIWKQNIRSKPIPSLETMSVGRSYTWKSKLAWFEKKFLNSILKQCDVPFVTWEAYHLRKKNTSWFNLLFHHFCFCFF